MPGPGEKYTPKTYRDYDWQNDSSSAAGKSKFEFMTDEERGIYDFAMNQPGVSYDRTRQYSEDARAAAEQYLAEARSGTASVAQQQMHAGLGAAQRAGAQQAMGRGSNPLAQRAAVYSGGQMASEANTQSAALRASEWQSAMQLQAQAINQQLTAAQIEAQQELARQESLRAYHAGLWAQEEGSDNSKYQQAQQISGQVSSAAGSAAGASDVRVKQDIQPVGGAKGQDSATIDFLMGDGPEPPPPQTMGGAVGDVFKAVADRSGYGSPAQAPLGQTLGALGPVGAMSFQPANLLAPPPTPGNAPKRPTVTGIGDEGPAVTMSGVENKQNVARVGMLLPPSDENMAGAAALRQSMAHHNGMYDGRSLAYPGGARTPIADYSASDVRMKDNAYTLSDKRAKEDAYAKGAAAGAAQAYRRVAPPEEHPPGTFSTQRLVTEPRGKAPSQHLSPPKGGYGEGRPAIVQALDWFGRNVYDPTVQALSGGDAERYGGSRANAQLGNAPAQRGIAGNFAAPRNPPSAWEQQYEQTPPPRPTQGMGVSDVRAKDGVQPVGGNPFAGMLPGSKPAAAPVGYYQPSSGAAPSYGSGPASSSDERAKQDVQRIIDELNAEGDRTMSELRGAGKRDDVGAPAMNEQRSSGSLDEDTGYRDAMGEIYYPGLPASESRARQATWSQMHPEMADRTAVASPDERRRYGVDAKTADVSRELDAEGDKTLGELRGSPVDASPDRDRIRRMAQEVAAEYSREDDDTLRSLRGYTYRYKPEAQQALNLPGSTRYGIMAQDVESTPLGKTMVVETPHGKAIDQQAATGATLALLGRLSERDEELAARQKVQDEMIARAMARSKRGQAAQR